MTFALAHLLLSTITMIIALLVFLADFNISGVTSWLLGSTAFGLTVANNVYYAQRVQRTRVRGPSRFMEPLELVAGLNAELVFKCNVALGLLVGCVFMLKGRKVLVELLLGLLKALYLLPPLLALFILKIALAVLFFARAFFSLVSLPPTKVSSYFYEYTSALMLCVAGRPRD